MLISISKSYKTSSSLGNLNINNRKKIEKKKNWNKYLIFGIPSPLKIKQRHYWIQEAKLIQ